MQIDGSLSKFDTMYGQLKQVAYWTNVHFNSRINSDKEVMIEDYHTLLQYKLKCPTAAEIAMHNVKKHHPITFPLVYHTKKENAEQLPHIKSLIKSIKEQDKKLYPRTAKLRHTLIKNNRFDFDYVKPKLSKTRKFILKLRSLV